MPSISEDFYVKNLNVILNDLESVYGLKTVDTSFGKPLCNLGIKDCLTQYQKIRKTDSRFYNEEALRSVAHLSYLSARMRYYGKIRLDFSRYPKMGKVADTLIVFTTRCNDAAELKKVNGVVVVLAEVDQKMAKAKFASGYRFLRLFVIMLLNGNATHASIVADFILNQFITR